MDHLLENSENSVESANHTVHWPPPPSHYRLIKRCVMVTSFTQNRERLFPDGPKLRMLHHALLVIAAKNEWLLRAWVTFPNHYHFIAQPGDGESAPPLHDFVQELHARTEAALNREDGFAERQVWQPHREMTLTYQAAYHGALSYVHQNAVKHRVVTEGNHYPYCSARWFESQAKSTDVATIYSFGTDRFKVDDDS